MCSVYHVLVIRKNVKVLLNIDIFINMSKYKGKIMKLRSVNGLLKPTKEWIEKNEEQSLETVYMGHYLIVSYLQIFKTGESSEENVFSKDRIEVGEEGRFRFFLPEKEYIYDRNVTIEVYSPDGEFLGKERTSYGNLNSSGLSASQDDSTDGVYSIEINPKIITVEKPDAKIKFYKKISGKLIDSSAQKDMIGLQIIVMTKRDNSDKYEALFSSTLDSSGYFYSQLEKHQVYTDAYAFIAGLDTEQIPIFLEEGEFPKNIILVADLSNLVEEEIKKSVGSLPNSSDLVNSSAFSQDLGGGCVDFTVPNRSLEEHSFFHTVRTTEPEIRSYTIGKSESQNFKQDLAYYSSNAFSIIKKLLDSLNSIGLYQYKPENSLDLTLVVKKLDFVEKDAKKANNPSMVQYTKTLQYMPNTMQLAATPVYFEINHVNLNLISDAIATYSANQHKLEQLHNKVQQAYCSSSVDIESSSYCGTIDVEYNVNYDALHDNSKSCSNNLKNNSYTISLNNGAYNKDVINFLVTLYEIEEIDNTQRKEFNKKIDKFISMLDTEIGNSEKYKSYKNQAESYLKMIRDNINYSIQNDICVDDEKTVAGVICLMNKYEKLKNLLANKAIFTLGEIMEIGAFYEEFDLSINYFSSLLQEFHTFYRKCNSEMIFIQDDYFIKNYKNINAELNQLKRSITLAKNKIDKIELEYIHNHPGRRNLNVDTSVDWDETPTVYENTTIAHGHILHFKQVWKADGYSLGDLLYSLPLAPCQEKQIAIVDWDRREEAERTEDQTVSDSLSANMSRDRDIDEIVNSTFNENVNARSTNKTKSTSGGASGGLGFSYGGFVAGASGGVSHSGSSSVSTASQNSARNLSGSTLNRLQDNVSQSASSVRSQRNTVIQAVGQNESVNVQTEVVKNNNHCHSMTIEYFEVLKHYAVEQELVDAQECLFVPLPMSDFDYKKVLRWKNTLQSSMYGKDLLKGFAAIERIESNRETGLPDGSYADEVIQELSGYFTISFDLVRPYNPTIDNATKTVIETVKLKSYFPWVTRDFVISYRKKYPLSEKEKNAIFEKEYAPEIVEKFIDTIGIYRIDKDGNEINLNTDVTLMSSYVKGMPLKVNIALTRDSKVTRREIKHLLFRAHTAVTKSSNIVIKSAYIHYRTDYMSEYILRNAHINNDIITTKRFNGLHFSYLENSSKLYEYVTDAALVYTPMSDKEKVNPKDEDIQAAHRLVDFLNEHLEMAHKTIWSNMDASRLFGLLDGYIAPNAKGRSVASVVENKVMGIVGNNLVLKVVPGEKLDPMLRGEDLLEHYKPDVKPDPFRISVPTKGVYAESVMGKCNSCEEIDESRHWRFEDVSCGVKPTAIDSVSTDTRRADVGNLQVKDLPTNIINMQTPQAAPDPSGLMAAYGLLGKSDTFNDMTGLAGTQANALNALQTTSKSVTDLASISKDFANLAVMAAQRKDMPKQLAALDKLKKEGVITPQEHSEKAKDTVDIYSNATKSFMPDASSAPTESESNKKIVETIASQGNIKSFKSKNKEGEETSVESYMPDGISDSKTTDYDNISQTTDSGSLVETTKDLSEIVDYIKNIINTHSQKIDTRSFGIQYGSNSDYAKKTNQEKKQFLMNIIDNGITTNTALLEGFRGFLDGADSVDLERYNMEISNLQIEIDSLVAEKEILTNTQVDDMESYVHDTNCIYFVAQGIEKYLSKYHAPKILNDFKVCLKDSIGNATDILTGRGNAAARFLEDEADFKGVLFSAYPTDKEYIRIKKLKNMIVPDNAGQEVFVGEIPLSAKVDKCYSGSDDLEKMKSIKLGFGLTSKDQKTGKISWGYHTFILISGRVYDAHWDKEPNDKKLFTERSLEEFIGHHNLIYVTTPS